MSIKIDFMCLQIFLLSEGQITLRVPEQVQNKNIFWWYFDKNFLCRNLDLSVKGILRRHLIDIYIFVSKKCKLNKFVTCHTCYLYLSSSYDTFLVLELLRFLFRLQLVVKPMKLNLSIRVKERYIQPYDWRTISKYSKKCQNILFGDRVTD